MLGAENEKVTTHIEIIIIKCNIFFNLLAMLQSKNLKTKTFNVVN